MGSTTSLSSLSAAIPSRVHSRPLSLDGRQDATRQADPLALPALLPISEYTFFYAAPGCPRAVIARALSRVYRFTVHADLRR